MISALDTSVLLDVLVPGAPYSEGSRRLLNRAARQGRLIICDAVYAELVAHFGDRVALERFLVDVRIDLVPFRHEDLIRAGLAFQA